MQSEPIQVLDHGYVKFIESWGKGEAGVPEAGIIEAARQSTQGSFRGWDIWHCNACGQNFDSKQDHTYDTRVPGIQINGATCAQKDGWSNDLKLLGFLYNSNPKHSTPFEFCGMTIEVQAPIFVFREWQRHRTQSYNEMSARYAPLPDIKYTPTQERLFLIQKKNKQAQAAGEVELTDEAARAWLKQIAIFYGDVEDLYQHGLDIGIPKEVARICLPVGQYSRMRASANLLNWLRFLTLRMHPNAQWEIRRFANAVGEIARVEFPRVWSLFDESRPK